MDNSQIVLIREPFRIVAAAGERNDDNIVGCTILFGFAWKSSVKYSFALIEIKKALPDA